MTSIHTSLKKVGRSGWDYMTSIHMSFERAGFVGGGGGGVEVGTGSPGLRRSRWFESRRRRCATKAQGAEASQRAGAHGFAPFWGFFSAWCLEVWVEEWIELKIGGFRVEVRG